MKTPRLRIEDLVIVSFVSEPAARGLNSPEEPTDYCEPTMSGCTCPEYCTTIVLPNC